MRFISTPSAAARALLRRPRGRVAVVAITTAVLAGGTAVAYAAPGDGDHHKHSSTDRTSDDSRHDSDHDSDDHDSDDRDSDDRGGAAPRVTVSQAIAAALKASPGTVTDAELDGENGSAVWEVDVTATDGQRHEVSVDASTGTARVDSTDDHDKTDKTDKQDKSDDGNEADDRTHAADDAKALQGVRITAAQAADIAAKGAPGSVREVDLHADQKTKAWTVVLVDQNGTRHVTVDAVTGQSAAASTGDHDTED